MMSQAWGVGISVVQQPTDDVIRIPLNSEHSQGSQRSDHIEEEDEEQIIFSSDTSNPAQVPQH